MKASTLLAAGAWLLIAIAPARAQIHVPLADASLAYPGAPGLTIQLGSTSRAILPTPFVLDGAFAESALWICMDPLQTMFVKTSGKPLSSELIYASDDPGLYDKWTPLAPGLSSQRLQDLADLFNAYAPTRSNLLFGTALQLAVPEITNEFDQHVYSLATGKFKAFGGSNATANSIVALAESMLASLDTPGVRGRGNVQSLRFLIDGFYGTTPVQDLVGFVPVPEPSTYAFFGVALLTPAFVLRYRRGRRERPRAS
ncbi:MAG TPA: PEP-CTERM sorting domain-containing protein [Opitutus sp.]|nr:PEP-CTERM sorting domain-containing protein [Opitutus sp.]